MCTKNNNSVFKIVYFVPVQKSAFLSFVGQSDVQ